MGNSLYLTAREKHDGYIFRTESQFDLSVRSSIWLNEILLAAQELLEPENEPLKHRHYGNRHEQAYMGGLDCWNVHFRTRPHRGDDNDRTELAETLHLEGRACRMVQGESAFLQETYPGCE